jgi:predicted nuclease of predicted toxin-antitoxin system
MGAASDEAIFERARDEGRILVSLDTDFGTLLAVRRSAQPSVILLRGHVPRRAADQLMMLRHALPSLSDALQRGAIVVLERGRARVRTLPISGADPGR